MEEADEEREKELLLEQQQQQQQRIPKEGEKQQKSSKSFSNVKKKVESGEKQERQKGFLVAVEGGAATLKGIMHAQERGQVFVSPGDEVYAGMLVGLHKRPNDLPVNICKAKKLTNMRAPTKTITEGLVPPLKINLDLALDLIG
ncbi:GTP-binding protein TypA, putative, partial [Eimeria tenella]